MANQVISVDRKKYAVGLFWQPTGAGYVARNYARTLARSVDKKLNLYVEYRSMVGLGARRVGHRSGMDCAAVAVMDTLAEYSSFLAVFAVGRQFYLVAVRNGVILEDKLFDKEEDARAEYFKLSEIPDWGALFAPGAWGMPRAVERNLADVVQRAVRAPLRPISRVRAGVASVILIVVFVFISLWFFRDPLNLVFAPRPSVDEINPEIVAEYQKQVEEKSQELDAQFDIKKPQVSAECGETHASVVFARDFGTLDDFYAVATEIMPGSFVQQESDSRLFVRATLPSVPTVASLDERDVETVMRAVLTAFQYGDMDADVGMVVDTLTNGVDTVNLDIVEVAAESKLNPVQFMRIFEEFGGVYMTRCAWDASTRNWNYEVIIYAK